MVSSAQFDAVGPAAALVAATQTHLSSPAVLQTGAWDPEEDDLLYYWQVLGRTCGFTGLFLSQQHR